MSAPSSHFTPWSSRLSSLHLCPKSPFFICLLACCCPSPSLISPVVSLPPINHRQDSIRNIVRKHKQRASAPGGHKWGTTVADRQAPFGLWEAGSPAYKSPRREVKRPNLSSATNFQNWASHIPRPLLPFQKMKRVEENTSNGSYALLL